MKRFYPKSWQSGFAAVLLTLTTACSGLFPTATPQSTFYSLDDLRSGTIRAAQPQSIKPTAAISPATAADSLPTLIVSPVQAAAGYDSTRMLYVREAHRLEYFAHNEWADTPARMLTAIVVSAIEDSAAFRAVVLTPTPAVGDIRLTVEVVRLQQHFDGGPSRVHFTLRANMVDYATRKVLASMEFDEVVTAASESPQGGVAAANRAVQNVMFRLARFCADAAAQWQSGRAAGLQTNVPGK